MKQIKTGQRGGSRPWWVQIECGKCGRMIWVVEHKASEKTAVDEALNYLECSQINYCSKCGANLWMGRKAN